MKINIDQSIKNFDGQPLVEVKGKDKTEIKFRTIIQNALNAEDNDHRLTAEKKVFAFQIGMKISGKKMREYDLTVKQVSFLKERIGIFYGPIIYGRFCELIGDLSDTESEE